MNPLQTVKEEANKRVSELQAAVSAAEAAAMEAQVQAAQVLAETIAEKDLAMERLRSASEVKQAGLNSELAAANARAEALQATVDSLSVQLSASTSDISAMKDAAEREVVTLTGVINSAMAVLSSPMAASVTDDGGGHPLLLAIAKLVHCVRVRDDAVRALELEKEELASLVLTQSHSAVVPAPPMPQRTGFPLETGAIGPCDGCEDILLVHCICMYVFPLQQRCPWCSWSLFLSCVNHQKPHKAHPRKYQYRWPLRVLPTLPPPILQRTRLRRH